MSDRTSIKGKGNISLGKISGSKIDIRLGDSGEEDESAFIPKHITIQSLAPPGYFTGREKVLKDIADALQAHRTAALYGISGLGKSSVVYKFAERHAEDYQYIIFVRADRLGFDANFDKTCQMMSLVFDAQDNEETKAVKFQNKIDELCAKLPENKRLLLIFDNVDEINRLRKFLPQHNRVNILLTSNFQDIHDLGRRVSIDNLSESDAMLLLYRKANASDTDNFDDIPKQERETLKQIAHLLGFHPFALSIAGLYIRKKRKTFAQYLARLRESQGKILKDEKGADAYQHATIYVAFEIPFNAISPSENIPAEEKNEVEIIRECLKIASVLAADNMPEEVFRETVSLILPHQTEFIADEDNWDNIYERLSQYGLFDRNPSTVTFSLHRLFRLFLDDKLKNERQTIEEPLAEILSKYFVSYNFTNKENVERFLSHVGSFLGYLEESINQNQQVKVRNEALTTQDQLKLSLENESTANLCDCYSWYYRENGQYKIAERYVECFKNICEGIEDINQSLLAISYNNLAIIYRDLTKYKKAEEYFLKSIELRKQISENETVSLAISYNQIAWLYEITLEYKKAEFYYLESIRILELINGDNHIDNCSSYNNLAVLYKRQGKDEKAEPLYIKAKDICREILGENHPNTARCYANLGAFYYKKGQAQEGLVLCERALKIFQNTLPANHPTLQNCESWIEEIKNSMSK